MSTDPDSLRTVSRGHGELLAGRPWPVAQDDVIAEATRRLIALPHVSALPEGWEDRAVTLADVVDLLCAYLPVNSVGEPKHAAAWQAVSVTFTAAYRRALTELGADRSLLFRRGEWPMQCEEDGSFTVLDADWYRAHGWRVTNVDDANVLVEPPTKGA